QAANYLSSKLLLDCDIYVTLEPCSMCAGALVLSRVKNIFVGALDPKTGGCCSVFNIIASSSLNHKPAFFSGIMEEECGDLLKEFFRSKRNRCSKSDKDKNRL
ncbi:MAG: nucleoside deaminase, partial [Candidatus Omnitrophica bacterium]|nr:nucleoside deaminase [Candidatus Omnitrophota bacterium]